MLEHVHQLDPNLDTRPGTNVRTIVEAAAMETASQEDLLRAGVLAAPQVPLQISNLAADHEHLERTLFLSLGLQPGHFRRHGRTAAREAAMRLLQNIDHGSQRWLERQIVGFTPQTLGMPNANGDIFSTGIQPMSMSASCVAHGTSQRSTTYNQRSMGDTTESPHERARREIIEEEDRQVFQILDDIAANGFDTTLDGAPIRHTRNPDGSNPWEVGPRGVDRGTEPWATEYMGEFLPERRDLPITAWMPIHSNPTISIDEIRNRRFNLIDRGFTNPCGEMDLGVGGGGEMSLDQMKKAATIIRPTAWQHILKVEELEYPV